MVGATGFEPATFRSRTGRSTRLSHAPTHCLDGSVSGHSVPRSRTECSRPQILEFQVLRGPGGNWGGTWTAGLGVVPVRASWLLSPKTSIPHPNIRAFAAPSFSSRSWPAVHPWAAKHIAPDEDQRRRAGFQSGSLVLRAIYSHRKATIGSTRAVLTAGPQRAAKAAAPSRHAARAAAARRRTRGGWRVAVPREVSRDSCPRRFP